MIEDALRKLPLVKNRRDEISGFGANFGVVISSAVHKPVIHSATFSHKDVLQELFSLLCWLGVLPQDFECTSFQVCTTHQCASTAMQIQALLWFLLLEIFRAGD